MKKTLLGLSILFILCFAGVSMAIDDFTVTESLNNDGDRTIQMIISDNRSSGSSPNSAEVSIDGVSLVNIDYKSLNDTDIPVTFVFVVDTTTTSYSDQKDRPKEIAEAISNTRKGDNDTYYLISFDKEVHAPGEPTKYADDFLKDLNYSVAGVGDYSDALQKAVELLKAETKKTLNKKVIILITDGYQVGNPSLQEGALIEMIRNAGYPVYSCGLLKSEAQNYISEDQKKLENLSKNTGGLYFSYESNQNPGKDIANHIARSGVLTGDLSETYSKAERGKADVKITLVKDEDSLYTINTRVEVGPIGETKNACELNPNAPECQKPDPKPSEGIKSWFVDHLGENWILIVIAGALLFTLIILIILTITKPGKKTGNEGPGKIDPDASDDDEGEITLSEFSAKVTLEDMNTGKRYNAMIPNGEARIFGRIDNRANGIIGIGGDPYISRKQFMITFNDDMVFIEDLGSENGTYLNGSRIRGRAGLQNGSFIRVGNISGEREYTVSLSKA